MIEILCYFCHVTRYIDVYIDNIYTSQKLCYEKEITISHSSDANLAQNFCGFSPIRIKTTFKIAYAMGCNYDEFFSDCSTASNFFRDAKYSDVLTVT